LASNAHLQFIALCVLVAPLIMQRSANYRIEKQAKLLDATFHRASLKRSVIFYFADQRKKIALFRNASRRVLVGLRTRNDATQRWSLF